VSVVCDLRQNKYESYFRLKTLSTANSLGRRLNKHEARKAAKFSVNLVLAMKKGLIIAGAVLGVAVAGAISVVYWKAVTITDPYVVEPVTASPAPSGGKAGHSVESNTRTLSILSSNSVVVVADPGVAFQYEVLWLVEKPRRDGSHTLMEYRCKMPQYAMAQHINPVGSQIPPKIQKVAEGNQWR
jgi:hypothetical protein